jgi:hypothetical protein
MDETGVNGMWVRDALTLATLLAQHEGGYFEIGIEVDGAVHVYHICRQCATALMNMKYDTTLRWNANSSEAQCIVCSASPLPKARP